MTTTCDPISRGDPEAFLKGFIRKAQAGRIPLSGTIQITSRCNLRCVHCYIGRGTPGDTDPAGELDTNTWLGLIDEMVAAGCLFLLITGGEPLVRKDFADIYRHARQSGLTVSVFSNGTLIDDAVVELFADLPPTMVDISVYGASQEVYESVTGIRGSFDACMAGIRKLLSGEVETRLKTVLMTHNQAEFAEIEALARELGTRFRLDPLIFPRFDGDQAPVCLRVAPEAAVAIEFSDEARARGWADFFRRFHAQPPDDRLYSCGAGVTAFYIDPRGRLQPCLMTVDYGCDIRRKGGFAEGWRHALPVLGEKKLQPQSACACCEQRTLCGYCPAFFRLETGSEHRPPGYLCEVGRLRLSHVKHYLENKH